MYALFVERENRQTSKEYLVLAMKTHILRDLAGSNRAINK